MCADSGIDGGGPDSVARVVGDPVHQEGRPEPLDPYRLLELSDDVGPLVPFMWYILSASETPLDRLLEFGTRIAPGAEEAVMATADWLRAEGETKGVAKERAEKAAALLALMVECRDEGRAEHAAGVFVRLLTRKFATVPDEVRARIDTASLEQLDTWTERVLDAETLNEVFEAP
jgi:hypothetical protein